MRFTIGLLTLSALPTLVLGTCGGCPAGQTMCKDGNCYVATYGCTLNHEVSMLCGEGCPDGQIMCKDGKCYDARWGCVGE
ncbi:uncharacterized protein PG998_010241 [Apiospora kogelbergensis]|uniref:uncharacterized protein n=1 Tax=Apiospora kogelbergensis TaxID=1337665 RepID=UPI00312F57A1